MTKTAFLGFLLLVFTVPLYSQSYDAELLMQKTSIRVYNNKLYKKHSFEIRINNRSGEKYTQIAVPFSGICKITNIEGCIKDYTGKIVKNLKNSDITERSASGDNFYSDDYLKEFTLKHNTYPYTIIYSYESVEDEFLIIENWTPVLDNRIPTIKAELTVEVPVDYQISYKSLLTDSTLYSDDKIRILKWTGSYQKIIKAETYAPSLYNYLPYVSIVPGSFIFDVPGSQKDWISYGNWQYDLLSGLNELPPSEKNKIMAMVNGVSDTRERIRILYNYLQDQTRYISISIETGGLKPYPAAYVAENKYGDCKALTNYFRAVLDCIGVRSFYTKVYAGDPVRFIDTDFPSQQFNHVILCVPVNGDTLWLDCTSDGPFNYLGSFSQNRTALIIDRDMSRLTRTPSLSQSDVLNSRKVTFKMPYDNVSEAKFDMIFKGQDFESFLYLNRFYNETQKAGIIRDYFSVNGFEINDYSFTEAHRDSSYIGLSLSARSVKSYKTYGNEIMISLIPFALPAFEDPEARMLPALINSPICEADTLIYEIPTGYMPVNEIPGFEIANDYGKYYISFIYSAGSVMVLKNFTLNPGLYSGDKYAGLYDFIREVSEKENQTYIMLTKKM